MAANGRVERLAKLLEIPLASLDHAIILQLSYLSLQYGYTNSAISGAVTVVSAP